MCLEATRAAVIKRTYLEAMHIHQQKAVCRWAGCEGQEWGNREKRTRWELSRACLGVTRTCSRRTKSSGLGGESTSEAFNSPMRCSHHVPFVMCVKSSGLGQREHVRSLQEPSFVDVLNTQWWSLREKQSHGSEKWWQEAIYVGLHQLWNMTVTFFPHPTNLYLAPASAATRVLLSSGALPHFTLVNPTQHIPRQAGLLFVQALGVVSLLSLILWVPTRAAEGRGLRQRHPGLIARIDGSLQQAPQPLLYHPHQHPILFKKLVASLQPAWHGELVVMAIGSKNRVVSMRGNAQAAMADAAVQKFVLRVQADFAVVEEFELPYDISTDI
ncbi:hypothetical protein OF83DRAFT_1087780 [Amylostereum chailletii]|nr:hypothetical protein OF83DRAFT_1087780 [Amylostereum chailletii]